MMKERIRVVLANRPRLLRKLVLTTILEQPDIEIVGVAELDSDILRIVELMKPDFLILALNSSGERPAICESVFERRPQLKTLAIAPEHDRAWLYWAAHEIRSCPVESSEQGILQTLRAGGTSAGGAS
jgi:AmiR/NasT family two-component response regulator